MSANTQKTIEEEERRGGERELRRKEEETKRNEEEKKRENEWEKRKVALETLFHKDREEGKQNLRYILVI